MKTRNNMLICGIATVVGSVAFVVGFDLVTILPNFSDPSYMISRAGEELHRPTSRDALVTVGFSFAWLLYSAPLSLILVLMTRKTFNPPAGEGVGRLTGRTILGYACLFGLVIVFFGVWAGPILVGTFASAVVVVATLAAGSRR